MKRLLFLAAVTFVLPKAQPLFPGMIVRCDQPQVIISSGPMVTTAGKFQCHWECEFGQSSVTFIEDGNEHLKSLGCAPQVVKPCNSYGWGSNFINTGVTGVTQL